VKRYAWNVVMEDRPTQGASPSLKFAATPAAPGGKMSWGIDTPSSVNKASLDAFKYSVVSPSKQL